jgi:hypothetical protein
MSSLSTVQAFDYAAILEDAAEELHILGRLVPPHYQYTESADDVCCFFLLDTRRAVRPMHTDVFLDRTQSS